MTLKHLLIPAALTLALLPFTSHGENAPTPADLRATQQPSELPPRTLKQQPAPGAPGGEMIWFDYPRSNWEVATQQVKEDGRIVRNILYGFKQEARAASRAAGPMEMPESLKKSESLEELRTSVHEYDDSGQIVRISHYDSQRDLRSYRVFRNDQKLAIDYSDEGIRHVENRSDGPVITGQYHPSTLIFDRQTGKRLLYFQGRVPDDIDLADGWGEASGGLRLGITSDGGRIAATIKNISESDVQVPRSNTTTSQNFPELIDAQGTLIPYDQQAMEQNASYISGIPTLAPGFACWEHLRLWEWYRNLKPGTYTFRIKRLGTDGKASLISNTLQITIPFPSVVTLRAMDDRIRIQSNSRDLDVFPNLVVWRASSPGRFVSERDGLTLEGVTVMAEKGKVTVSTPTESWSATLENGRIRLLQTKGNAASKEHLRTKIQIRCYEGKIEITEE